MKIAIIGHGNVGGALAKKWAAGGHHIMIGARHPEDDKVQKILSFYQGIRAASIKEAVEESDVILFATPATAVPEIIYELGDLSGKIVIDATNALREKPDLYKTAFEAIRNLTKADVAKCFNTTGFENMENPNYGDTTADMFVAGNSEKARKAAVELASDAGFKNCYDFGGDDKVEALEALAFAWINLAIFQHEGRNMAFKILKR